MFAIALKHNARVSCKCTKFATRVIDAITGILEDYFIVILYDK
mgnify:CR=1 FL=1